MKRFRPIHGLLIVILLMAAVLGGERLLSSNRNRYVRVAPDANGTVVLDVGELAPLEVRFFRFLNAGNQEVKFFVGRDERGTVQVAFDASENDFKLKRGFHAQDGWVVNNKCSTAVRLAEVNSHPGGCSPVPVRHRLAGTRLVLAENDLLEGWRYFR